MHENVPAWVGSSGDHKYHRALTQLKKAGGEVTEEAVKALYTRMGGALNEVSANAVVEEPDAAEEAPKPRTRRAK